MRFIKKPIAALSAGVLISGILFTHSVDASQARKSLDAHYNNIKIMNNNQLVSVEPSDEPFIVNGTTFIPLRMMGELFNKSVIWDGVTQTIKIADNSTPISQATIDSLKAQISAKDAQILKLQTELNNLKGKEVDLGDLEDQLNDDYGDYDDIDDVEIFLAGDEDLIDIRIDVDSRDWDDLSDSEKEDFLQEIVDDILDDYEDAEIEGTIKDGYNSDTLATFESNSDGDIEFENTGVDLDDLEDQLNDDYEDFRDLDDVAISLSGDEEDIDITIEVDKADWDTLDEDEKLDFLQDIVDDMLDEFEDAFIDGRINDSDNASRLDTFYADGEDDGDVTID
ncbi:stalk domain-containing protein [Bacillus sp. Marseille-P3661]|uniref:stalk domain-containing protein n=1 Tax=Bacillus sp. Marseille-P3661 TaxID=1936234 RepID=UPI000C8183D9|nr:stalk domain-containing protein [Bacillus sp. Marseille-P3661]